MKRNVLFVSLMFVIMMAACSPSLAAWTESPADPIYNPFPATPLPEDYFPIIVYDGQKFSGHGDAYFYKMWHQGTNGIALSYSDDGIHWTLKSDNVVINGPNPAHPCVVYDENGFGGGSVYYKAWYWKGYPAAGDVSVIQYSESSDGIVWKPSISVTQDASSPLSDGIPGYFYHLYGPGAVLYNPAATSTAGQPYTFPYVMFYDTSNEGGGPGKGIEQIALAYSSDGLAWTRYGSEPIIIPSGVSTDWDGAYAYRPSLIRSQSGTYYLLYSGSNDQIDPTTTIPYAHGIGVATSLDGIHWTKSTSNPVFSYADGSAWRNSRTYAPSVLLSSSGGLQMWFSGGTGLTAGMNQGIGYVNMAGPTGAQGPAGATGPQGPIGLTGPAGATGPQGLAGLTGPAGPQGPAGATGPQGPIGLTGPAGATGPQGLAGLTGPAGPQGPAGDAGLQGPVGLTGPAGPQGSKGDKGDKGDSGSPGGSGAPFPSLIEKVYGLKPDTDDCRIVFVTSMSFNGNLGGLAGADQQCRNLATVAGLYNPTNYKAWLSDNTTNAADRLEHATLPYLSVRGYGTIIAQNWDDLVDGALANPIRFDEYGRLVTDSVWTGTMSDGTKASSACSNWTSAKSTLKGSYGLSSDLTSLWTDNQPPDKSCSQKLRLYCVEQ